MVTIGERIGLSLEGVNIDKNTLQTLRRCELDLSKEYPDPRPLLSIDGRPLITYGNISVIVGLPGSRKSFFATAVVSALIRPDGFMGMENEIDACNIVWIDTEQAIEHVGKIASRVKRITGNNAEQLKGRLTIYMLREFAFEKRRELFEATFPLHKPKFVILDGVSDLISDPNDAAQADDIISLLMALSKEYDCHIMTVVHCNVGSDKARGHLGSEILRKCETALHVSANGETSKVTFSKTRNMPPNPFMFGVSDGLPQLIDQQTRSSREESKRLELVELFSAILKTGEVISYTNLTERVMRRTGVRESASKKRISSAVSLGIVCKNERDMYHLPIVQTKDEELPF